MHYSHWRHFLILTSEPANSFAQEMLMDSRQVYESFDLVVESCGYFAPEHQMQTVLCCDRHCGQNRRVLRWTDDAEATARLTFELLSEES